jgi:hypothetical protein
MVSCVVMCWPPNGHLGCVPNVFNPCSHSQVKRLNVKGWIKLQWQHNIEVKIKCVMWNEQIDGLAINLNPVPLPKQKWMWAIEAEKMESSSKIGITLQFVPPTPCSSIIKSIFQTSKPTIITLTKNRCVNNYLLELEQYEPIMHYLDYEHHQTLMPQQNPIAYISYYLAFHWKYS